jgi:hypothetical protein
VFRKLILSCSNLDAYFLDHQCTTLRVGMQVANCVKLVLDRRQLDWKGMTANV